MWLALLAALGEALGSCGGEAGSGELARELYVFRLLLKLSLLAHLRLARDTVET